MLHPIHNGFQMYWYPPASVGDSVTGYDVEYRAYNAVTSRWGNWSDAGHTGTDTFLLRTGLNAQTRYETRVRAWIGNRYSRWSLHGSDANRGTARNYQGAGRPDPPTVPTATADHGKITVLWTDPGTANNSVAATVYQVAWRSGSEIKYSPRLPATTGGNGPLTYRFDVLYGVDLRHSGFAFDPATRVLSSITGDGVSPYARVQYVAYTVTDSTGETGRAQCFAIMRIHAGMTMNTPTGD
ncbi:fibronectin type III domain-containing protein [Candidatus Poriferisodalis sp.]|uniref:fibronectin type III domain-containing protein n=1 Tax=Candidatus Poriferisodalis sp. TaxID=3101277 RepID=UPI003B01F0E4